MTEIFSNLASDLRETAYLIIDALDECIFDLPKLLDYINLQTSESPRIKWILSSRNEERIERSLYRDDNNRAKVNLELEGNALQVSRAVDAYVGRCVSELAEIQENENLQAAVREELRRKANGTFLWVSLAVKELKEAMSWEMLEILKEVPLDLNDIYHRMTGQIKQLKRQYPILCRQVLSTVMVAFRPLRLQELHALAGLPTHVTDVASFTISIVKMCGSFLTIREERIYVIHQSVKDFFTHEGKHDPFLAGIDNIHFSMLTNSLSILSGTLKKDINNLRAPAYPIEKVDATKCGPLNAVRYACMHWIDHFGTMRPQRRQSSG